MSNATALGYVAGLLTTLAFLPHETGLTFAVMLAGGVVASLMAIWHALRMPPIEQLKRMRILRNNVAVFDASWWASRLVDDLSRDPSGAVPCEPTDQRWSSAVA